MAAIEKSISETLGITSREIPGYKVYSDDTNLVALWSMSVISHSNMRDEISGITLSPVSTWVGPFEDANQTMFFNHIFQDHFRGDADDISAINLNGSDEYTIVARQYTYTYEDTSVTAQYMTYMSAQYSLYYMGQIILGSNNSKYLFRVYSASGSGWNDVSWSGSKTYLDKWNVIAGKKSTDGLRLYHDAYLVGSNLTAINTNDGGGDLYVGGFPSVAMYSCLLDYVAIFNTALSLPKLGGIAAYGIIPRKSISEGLMDENNISGLVKAILDQDIINEAITEYLSLGKTLNWELIADISDTLSLLETLIPFVLPVDMFSSQNAVFTNSFSYQLDHARSDIDGALSISESVAYLVTAASIIGGTAALTESLYHYLNPQIFSDSIGITGSASFSLIWAPIQQNNLGITESLSYYVRGFLPTTMIFTESLFHKIPIKVVEVYPIE